MDRGEATFRISTRDYIRESYSTPRISRGLSFFSLDVVVNTHDH